MMIECPKCGFRQPDDQFCASCGVNIKTYVHNQQAEGQTKSSHKKSYFILAACTLAGLTLSWGLINRYKHIKLNDHSTHTTRQAREFESLLSKQKLLQQEAPTPNPSAETEQAVAAPPTTNPPVEIQNKMPGVAASTTTDANPRIAAENPQNKRQIEALYFEVPSDTLPLAISKAQNYKTYGEVSLGVLDRNEKEVGALIQNLLRIRKPQTMAQNASAAKVTARLSQYSRLPNETVDIGITLLAEVSYTGESEAQVKLQFGQNFSKLIQQQNAGDLLPAQLTVKKGQLLLFIGFLPRREFTPAEAQFFQRHSILATALSPAFQSGQNEFAILLDVFKE